MKTISLRVRVPDDFSVRPWVVPTLDEIAYEQMLQKGIEEALRPGALYYTIDAKGNAVPHYRARNSAKRPQAAQRIPAPKTVA